MVDYSCFIFINYVFFSMESLFLHFENKRVQISKTQTKIIASYILIMVVICILFVPWVATINFGISLHYNYQLGYHPIWKVPAFNAESKYQVIDQSKLIYQINGCKITGLKPYVLKEINYGLLILEVIILTICFLFVMAICNSLKDPETKKIISRVVKSFIRKKDTSLEE